MPEPGQMPLAKPSPKSPLLAYNTEKEEKDSDHFFNPASRMHNTSTISKRFEPGEVGSLKNSSRVKMKKVKTKPQGVPRASTRVRSSFFAIFMGKKPNRETINANGTATGNTRRKKRNFFQRLFGFRRKKRKAKFRDDIMDVNNDEKVEALDISFSNEPIDPRQHMRNTAKFFMSRGDTIQGEDLYGSEASATEVLDAPDEERDIASVDLFEVDKARQSTKHDSLWQQFSPEADAQGEPLKPEQRNDLISFVGSGKMHELQPAGRTTLKESTLPRHKKPGTSSHLFLSNNADFESPPLPSRSDTLRGEDLPKTPQVEKKRSSFNKTVDERPLEESSVLTSNSFKRKISRNNSVMSAKRVEKSPVSKPEASPPNSAHKSENLTLPPPAQTSGVWSVDERVVSVLASAATLKRKKKQAETRASPDRVNSVAKTEASLQAEDAELLGILASPQTAARKKGSFSSFKSFEANL